MFVYWNCICANLTISQFLQYLNFVLRPVGIYKEDYIQELYRRYDDVDDAPPAPNLPDWCLESDDGEGTNNFDDFEDSTDGSASTSSK